MRYGLLALAVVVAACGGGNGSPSPAEVTVDTTPPVITLTGDNPQVFAVGDAYVELGATATDNRDGDLTASIVIDASSVNSSLPGGYLVTYDVSDAAGNAATTAVRTVVYEDRTPPVITLLGADPQVIALGSPYVELGATATDNVDGDLTDSIVIDASAVDTGSIGNYTVSYDVSDAAGNAAVMVTRTVIYEDQSVPGNAKLADLTLSTGNLNQSFLPEVAAYSADVNLLVPAISITATAEEGDSTITVNEVSSNSGSPSERVPLDLGSNLIDVVVTSVDGVTTETYTIDVIRHDSVPFAQTLHVSDLQELYPLSPPWDDWPDIAFGTAVALEDNTMLVGASGLDLPVGAVYVFVRENGVWIERQKLSASDEGPCSWKWAHFGRAIATDGDVALIGSCGSVYVFERDDQVWSEIQKLQASDAPADETHFGGSIALDGDTAVIKAPDSVYVFTRDGGVWSERQKLTSDDLPGDEPLAGAVAIDGDTLVVGGSVFGLTGGIWVAVQKLEEPEPCHFWGFDFGATVAIDGDTILIGAPGYESSCPPPGEWDYPALYGAVFTYVRSDGVWQEQQMLEPSDALWDDEFGAHVSLDGNTAIISTKAGQTPAYVFVLDNGQWAEVQRLLPDSTASYLCYADENCKARPTAFADGYAVIGDPGATSEVAVEGAALVFGCEDC